MLPMARCAMAEPVPNAIPSATMLPNEPIMDLCCGGWPTGGGAPACWEGARLVGPVGFGAPNAVVSFVCTFHQYVCPVVSSLTSSHGSSSAGGGAALPTGLLAPRNLPRPRVDISRACTTVGPASASRAAAESDGPRSRRPTRRSARRVDMFCKRAEREACVVLPARCEVAPAFQIQP